MAQRSKLKRFNSPQPTNVDNSGIVRNRDYNEVVQDITEIYTTISQLGGGLEGTNYIYVAANGTDTENAAELQAAYDQAQTLYAASYNRITIICAPGYYNFGTNTFLMDSECIDLVSLDGNRSIVFNSADPSGTISIIANDVFVKGVDVESKNFTIDSNLNLLKVENCKGGDYSFGGDPSFSNPITVSGTFVNCIGGSGSFGGSGTASGIFTDCIGSNASFGGNATASGTFTNCKGQFASFGGAGIASGTFTDCQSGAYSFGALGTASGLFNNCIGSDFSFGGFGTASGVFKNCEGAQVAFGGNNTASGTFTNCIGDDNSFAGNFPLGNTITGKLFYCRLTSGTFEPVSGGGVTLYCIDGNNEPNNQGFTPQNKV